MKEKIPHLTGAQEIALAYVLTNELPGSLLDLYSAEQLVRIARAYNRCSWDVSPARWRREQLEAAAHDGTVPTFDEFDTDGGV